MIRLNLLPYREEEVKRRKRSFFALLVLGAILGLGAILLFAGFMAVRIADQSARNNTLKTENTRLDGEIKQVATLKEEIQALKARQQAVEDLQADRNQPVFLMSELVQQTPEGIYLKSLKQDGQRVTLNGYAQSNERVAEYLRNMGNNSAWLQRPDLVEIKASETRDAKPAKDAKAGGGMRNVFEFTVNVAIKRPRDNESKDGQPATAPAEADAAKAAGNGSAKGVSGGDAAKLSSEDKAKQAAEGNGTKSPDGGNAANSPSGGSAAKPSAPSTSSDIPKAPPSGGDPAKSSAGVNAQKS